jgi:excisionase family DNA binding protein
MPPANRFPRLYSINEIADALGVSTKTVRRLIDASELHASRIGRQLRISEEDYRTFVALRRR